MIERCPLSLLGKNTRYLHQELRVDPFHLTDADDHHLLDPSVSDPRPSGVHDPSGPRLFRETPRLFSRTADRAENHQEAYAPYLPGVHVESVEDVTSF